jgi:hypothetical protein
VISSAVRYKELLNTGESVLAEAIVQSPKSIGREGAPRYRALVTNQRLLLTTAQRRPKPLGEWALAEIQEIKGDRTRVLGFPVVQLTIALSSGEYLLLATTGLGSSQTQHLTEVLRSAWLEEIAPRIKAEHEERARRLAGKEDLVLIIQHVLLDNKPIDPDIVETREDYRIEAEEITLRLSEVSSKG